MAPRAHFFLSFSAQGATDSAQVPESKSKSTEAIAEVDLDLDEGDFETNTMGYMI